MSLVEGSQSTCDGPTVDLLVVIDDSSSMVDGVGDPMVSQEVRNASLWLIEHVVDTVADVRVGLAVFNDYEGAFEYPDYKAVYGLEGDLPWNLLHPLTGDPEEIDEIKETIRNLEHTRGDDAPGSNSRVLHEAARLDWADGANRLVGLITDTHPHDDTFFDESWGLDPGRDATEMTEDDIDFEEVTQEVAEQRIKVIAAHVHSITYEDQPDHRNRTEDSLKHVTSETGGIYTTVAELKEEAETITAKATKAPSLEIQVPKEGGHYQDGEDVGQAPRAPVASVQGPITFEVKLTPAVDDEPVTHVTFAVEANEDQPGPEWSDDQPVPPEGGEVKSTQFPTDEMPRGLYRLDVIARYDDGSQAACVSQYFERPPIGQAGGTWSAGRAVPRIADTGPVISDASAHHETLDLEGVTIRDVTASVEVSDRPWSTSENDDGRGLVVSTVTIGYLAVPTEAGLLEFEELWIRAGALCDPPGDSDPPGYSEMEVHRMELGGEDHGSLAQVPPTLVPGDLVSIHRQVPSPSGVEAAALWIDPPGAPAQAIGYVLAEAACGGLSSPTVS